MAADTLTLTNEEAVGWEALAFWIRETIAGKSCDLGSVAAYALSTSAAKAVAEKASQSAAGTITARDDHSRKLENATPTGIDISDPVGIASDCDRLPPRITADSADNSKHWETDGAKSQYLQGESDISAS
ncbi:hypothetical protein [Rhodococcus sp. 1139]|uniref:hypothetical protein n=1 Tax=Rhodococcus sp. 1139 TaxID=1833762 RepID=UPI0008728E92|nr:hypothetical protein [Rhodococcus sp. 1139]OFE10474.1 hypothetical protein A5N83_02350 [Rhodococcus sp. 1139]